MAARRASLLNEKSRLAWWQDVNARNSGSFSTRAEICAGSGPQASVMQHAIPADGTRAPPRRELTARFRYIAWTDAPQHSRFRAYTTMNTTDVTCFLSLQYSRGTFGVNKGVQ